MPATAIAIPSDARLIVPATDAERDLWNDRRGWTLEEITLTTYVIRLRMSKGAEAGDVFTSATHPPVAFVDVHDTVEAAALWAWNEATLVGGFAMLLAYQRWVRLGRALPEGVQIVKVAR